MLRTFTGKGLAGTLLGGIYILRILVLIELLGGPLRRTHYPNLTSITQTQPWNLRKFGIVVCSVFERNCRSLCTKNTTMGATISLERPVDLPLVL